MEKMLFAWNSCDDQQNVYIRYITFRDCVLEGGVLPNLKCREYDRIDLDYNKGTMTLWNDGSQIGKYKLELSVIV